MSGQYKYIPPQPPLGFTLGIIGGFGALTGLLTAQGEVGLMPLYLVVGALLFSAFGLGLLKSGVGRGLSGWVGILVFLAVGSGLVSLPFGVLMALWGFFIGRMVLWLDSGRYRLPLPPYASTKEVLWFYTITGWWSDVWNNAQWVRSIRNSFYIGILATILSTALGTLAAIGLASSDMPWRRPIMALLISPMIVPLVITASGLAFFFADIKLVKTYWGIILAHAVLGTPFVIITVTATLSGFDKSLTRASANMGAGPVRTFFKVQMPLILPGVISGALFAFITSFDEVVAVLQLADVRQRTIPRQMFSGIREQISPTILAVATILVIISIALLTVVELLRRRSERLRGMSPS
jgi:putative spermidine/putrescine transport system permease protein